MKLKKTTVTVANTACEIGKKKTIIIKENINDELIFFKYLINLYYLCTIK